MKATDGALAGKWALVTGASRGIGKAISERLAVEGVHVAIHYNSSAESAGQVAEICRNQGVQTLVIQGDLSAHDGAVALAKGVSEAGVSVDILVNNAGTFDAAPLWSCSDESWERVQRVNFESSRKLIQAFLGPMLQKRWGRIVNLSSILGRWGGRGNASYCVSKAALDALTRVAAIEVGRKGITVNAIAPGLVATEMAEGMGEEMQKRIIERTPLRRAAEPSEIAEAVVFLCRCGYVTGEVLCIDGGLRQSF
jgi:NAD(P)-dependent dehydrogenase (short-subunit alcohol dehydrogenase family)